MRPRPRLSDRDLLVETRLGDVETLRLDEEMDLCCRRLALLLPFVEDEDDKLEVCRLLRFVDLCLESAEYNDDEAESE